MPGEPYGCPICGDQTHHPTDVRLGYCPRCHAFTRDCSVGLCRERPAVVLGNIAACAAHAGEILGEESS